MHKKKVKLLSILLISILSVTGCSVSEAEQADNSNTLEVKVTKGDIREEISLSGSVEANKITSVSSSGKSTVKEIYVDVNEDVSEGEDILLLENGDVVEAPFDGKVSKISVSEGDSVDTSTAVFNIVDNSGFKIEASVGETEVTKVAKGQSVEVTVSALNKNYEGTVTSVDGEATSNGSSASFGLSVSLSGDFDNLYTGMSAEMSIIIQESKDVLVVPIQAVSSKGGKHTVSLKSTDETKDVEISIGAQDSSFVEITSGLSEGDVVIYKESSRISQQGGSFNKMSGEGMPGGSGKMPSDMPSGERPSGIGEMPSGVRKSN